MSFRFKREYIDFCRQRRESPPDPDCPFEEPERLHRHGEGCPSCLPFQVEGIYQNCEWVRGMVRDSHQEDIKHTKNRVRWLYWKANRWLPNEDKFEEHLEGIVIETLALWRQWEKDIE